MANVARVNAASLAALALAPAPPRNVRMLAGELSNDTTLAWEASPDGRAYAYEVVWRPTTESYWEWVEEAGDHQQVTLPRSKDNVIFAVRSTDRHGHKSLPVVPRPVKNFNEK